MERSVNLAIIALSVALVVALLIVAGAVAYVAYWNATFACAPYR